MSKKFISLLSTIIIIATVFTGCGDTGYSSMSENDQSESISIAENQNVSENQNVAEQSKQDETEIISSDTTEVLTSDIEENLENDVSSELPTTQTQSGTEKSENTSKKSEIQNISNASVAKEKASSLDLSSIPEFSNQPYIAVNGNIPFFTSDEITQTSFENYAALDAYGRCGVTVASIGRDLMPTEERGSIGMVKPTGWHTVKYDCVDGKYLYNRCHLIGFQLSGENANTSNLITGTRYLNIEGMLPFENMVADYVKETGNHVMYRSTPIFEGNNLLAKGVLMEGLSVEDGGKGICYCVFAYNAQPGVILDYSTGDSRLSNDIIYSDEQATTSKKNTVRNENQSETENKQSSNNMDYVINKNTKKFHYPSCSSVKKMAEKNKEYFNGSRDELISRGYDPCKNCNP